ncbi:DEAD/DEAH box helicase [Tissierella sp. Yu-01]|uniref:DEAD/DEAH box helicase n=1 Tax=Tissierella sp. Yu-01 TaxID=3035694 RepID=UPI00240D8FB5|nr:DEAD/DEAH box helicase [Tissierella sp. Yu-01]WFA10074.1 DEAD/DEAH box helicase [Tissierella sp. Yu-01]
MKVYFSHTGVNNYAPEIDIDFSGSFEGLIDCINQVPGYSQLKNTVLNNGKIRSSTRIFVNVVTTNSNSSGLPVYKYYEGENTREISNIYENIHSSDINILIAIFDAEKLLHMINNSLTEQTGGKFNYIDDMGRPKGKDYKPTISEINFSYDVLKEDIHEFRNGDTTLESLKYSSNQEPTINFNQDGFLKHSSKLLVEDLVEAIRDIWELPDGMGTLRLFQEDSLFFIMAKLFGIDYPKEKHLLLSMPTGGGKTEAFMIPLLARIYHNKISNPNQKGIQSIVIYPTNALANDQAMRFVELIYKVNKKLTDRDIPLSRHISIGILSGDTPNRSKDLSTESLIRICPKCGKSDKWEVDKGQLICINELFDGSRCGTRLSFCRLTKEDIINDPPDIIITNPDMINYALHSPKYMPILRNKIESIVFDEVHIYQGILGCHVSHLLRRLEELMEKKPLYIGMSATIGNAKELASLLFDEELDNIKYIRNENNKYLTDKVTKTRTHVLITPYYIGKSKTGSGGTRERYLAAMTVAGTLAMFIGHLITDSHFRKSIIFTNYRADADKIAGDLRERERLDIRFYFEEIIERVKANRPITQEEVEICLYMDQWVHEIIDNNNAINNKSEIGWNRGGLEKQERIRSIHSFSRNNLLADITLDDAFPIDIMVATKTLEVGIDIGDVTTVINSSAPFTINEYVQRIGRGGRKKDSVAITVINPESAIDCHMKNNFNNYVYAKTSDFEDAPIIINNEIIVEKHIKARIVDYFTKRFLKDNPYSDELYVSIGDIVDRITITKNGVRKLIGDGVSPVALEEYIECLYGEIFHRKIEDETVANRLLRFLQREESIIGTEACEFTEDDFKKAVSSVIKDLNKHLQSRGNRGKWEKNRYLVGRDNNAAMPDLTPSLRGSGATVSLYTNNNENSVDVVSRQTAFSSMPLSNEYAISTTISGVSSFIVKDDKGESDKDAEILIRRAICNFEDNTALEYFNNKLDDFPYSDDMIEVASTLNVLVPKKLRVAYFPSRFYCEHCERGLIPGDDYDERFDGVYCKSCGRKAVQLHKIYSCADDECGHLYDPPIPKMCINPECNSVKAATKIYKDNNYSFKGRAKDIRNLFKFRITNNLEWVCRKCGTRQNFSVFYMMKNGNKSQDVQRILGMRTSPDKKNTDYLPYIAKWYPETPNFSNQNDTVFSCKVCTSRKIKTISVPSVRTVSYSYVGNKVRNNRLDILCESLDIEDILIEFSKGYVIQLAQEYIRRFTNNSGNDRSYSLKTERIFDKQYWGNYYESHLAWFKFGDKIDEFLNTKKYTCSGHCSTCNKFDDLDLGKMMKPKRTIEEYNYDSVKQKPKKPDHRGKYCDTARDNNCNRQYCQCEDGTELCDEFNEMDYLRYIIIHTLKHGMLWSLPKYAGVNVSEVRGEVYPNDKYDSKDLVLIDNNEGGSGAIILIRKHWAHIWKFANDIIGLTCENKANIILPHSCSRYNADLCPFITKEYLDYLKQI